MIRPLAILLVLVLALAAWDVALERRRMRERAEESRVGTLFTPDETERLRKQPALRIELAGESHLYGRVEGEWRCLSYHRAPADGAALQRLLDTLARAEGIVHSSSVDEAPAYGINAPETIHASILGPRALDRGGDVQASFDLGKSIPGRGASFLRKQGTKEIWAIDGDPRAELEHRIAPALPPLLAPTVVPAPWLEESGGLARVTVERGVGPGFTLERRERALGPEELAGGKLPWTWVLDPDGSAQELPGEAASAYAGYVERAPYLDVLEGEKRAESDFEPPAATIVLSGREGAPLRLVFGSARPDRRVPLWVERSQALYLVAPEVFELCAPDPARLAQESEENPWSAALRGEGDGR